MPASLLSRSGWPRLLLLALVALPPLFVGLGAGDSDYHMEVRALQSAQETWLRQSLDPLAWLMPTWNGEPRINKPPLAVWIDLLAWSDLPPSARIDQLIWRARAAAAALASLLVLAVYLTGRRLRDDAFGGLAAAATATTLFFLRQARLASYDTYFMALAGIAVCGGLCALIPRADGERAGIRGWTVFGLALGLAVLAKGPLAWLLAGAPVVLLAAWSTGRKRLLAGAGAGLLLSVAVAAPWYAYLLHQVPGAAAKLWTEYEAGRPEGQPFWYYAGLLALVAPWCLWLPAGLWCAARRGAAARPWADRAVLFCFVWIFVVLSIPAAKQQRYLAVILPVAGWLIALGWNGVSARALAHTQGALMGAASLVTGLIGVLQPWALSRGLLDRRELEGVPGYVWAAAGLLLLVLSVSAWHLLLRNRREAAGWLTAAWMAGASVLLLPAYERSHHGRYAHRADAERVAALTSGRPFYHLADRDTPAHLLRPPPAFLLYLRRTVPDLAPHTARAPDTRGWLMAPRTEKVDQMLRRAGWSPVTDFDDGSLPRALYSR
jgi:4-amino-4-deoxy-L-arabinose transferase-like glycosyltransferase